MTIHIKRTAANTHQLSCTVNRRHF